MGIEKIDMYCVKCDGCYNTLEFYDGMIACTDLDNLKDEIGDSDWVTVGDNNYCTDCHFTQWDDEGENLFAFTYDEGGGTTLLGLVT